MRAVPNAGRSWLGIPQRGVEVGLVSGAIITLALLAAAPHAGAVLQGHLEVSAYSPVVMLVIDPNGNEFGCTSIPCTSSASPGFVDNLPSPEAGSYDFAAETITIQDPTPGTWTVEYIGTGTGTFTIKVEYSSNYLQQTLISGSVTEGATGSGSFGLGSDGTITISEPSVGVPEFPMGVGLVFLAGLAALLAMRRRLRPAVRTSPV